MYLFPNLLFYHNLTNYLQQKSLYPPLIHRRVSRNLGLVIVIPAYNEPYLLRSLMALKRCTLGRWDVEVIVVINDAEGDSMEVKRTNKTVFEQAQKWIQGQNTSRLQFRILYMKGLSDKFAGVGLARKIGMDEACYRFEKIKKKTGVIACFDADSACLSNYFQAIEQFFEQKKHLAACSIYFEHPLDGADHSTEVYEAITAYELHLRYFINAQRWVGVPYAFQTIGSAMAVRANHYQQQGGMNKRKAGEDFYFLHKFISIGKCGNLTSTKVIPSPRVSDRVPFGTGKAVQDILQSADVYKTYSPRSFYDLKAFIKMLPALYAQPEVWETLPISDCVKEFLEEQDFGAKIVEIHKNISSKKAFIKRFYIWFNAFRLMKFVHFSRGHYYENVDIETAAKWLLEIKKVTAQNASLKSLLLEIRKLDNPYL